MRFLALILFVLSAFTALADEKKYGSFIFNTEIPDTLFFIDEIKANDSFELRKALRNHDIQNIVLASPGGNVWEGLQMAGIIFDKQLRTYIPRGGICASACSFLFFAGNERLADGALGVHQAKSRNAQQKQVIGQTQFVTQFTVSEIIGFLNEFGTPAFVYERMFQDIDMYFFDPLELMELNSDAFHLENSQKIAATKFMMAKIEEQKNQKPELPPQELIAMIQIRLKEIGCNPGPADGIWGQKTEDAARRFAKLADLPTDNQITLSATFIDRLEQAKPGFCPKIKLTTKAAKATTKKINRLGELTGTWYVRSGCLELPSFQLKGLYVVGIGGNNKPYQYWGTLGDSRGNFGRVKVVEQSNGNIEIRHKELRYTKGRLSLKIAGYKTYAGEHNQCSFRMAKS